MAIERTFETSPKWRKPWQRPSHPIRVRVKTLTEFQFRYRVSVSGVGWRVLGVGWRVLGIAVLQIPGAIPCQHDRVTPEACNRYRVGGRVRRDFDEGDVAVMQGATV